MQKHTQRWVGMVSTVLVLAMIFMVKLSVAAPPGQEPILPTPTPFPADDVVYTLEIVGGQPQTLMFTDPPMDGFTLGLTTVTMAYPRGMVFTVRPESTNGAIEDVILFVKHINNVRDRAVAEWDADQAQWRVHLWETGGGHPAWTHIEFFWRVRDETGAVVDTPAHPVDYADPTRQWFRLDTAYMTVYWFGLSDDDPDRFAREMAVALAGTHPRRVDGFGQAISYKPIGVIYSSRETMGEMFGNGAVNRGAAYTRIGMSVLPVVGVQPDFQRDWMSFTTVHELVHLYQSDLLGANTGPTWWLEGQAQWFSTHPGLYDERLQNLATLQDLPSLTTEVTREVEQADGRSNLSYDMGASFINWLVAQHGGLDTHAGVVAQMVDGASLYDALETVTGIPFFDLENEWRAYIGLEPLSLADLDPVAALEPALDPLFEAGAVVTLPAVPPLVPLYAAPGPRQLTSGQCFAGMEVTILALGSLEGVDYYQLDCMGQVGWVTGETLAGAE